MPEELPTPNKSLKELEKEQKNINYQHKLSHNENYNDLIFKNNYLFGKLTLVLPHPSPLNIKWFKDNPDFMNKRIIEIRKIINDTLNN